MTTPPPKQVDLPKAKIRGRCPLCRQPTHETHRPFCSKRCADVDLGRWLKGSYAVPGEPAGEAGAAFLETPDDLGE